VSRKVYVWTTWLTKLLAGEHLCEWALWFKAHNRGYEQLINPDFDLDQWRADHDRLVTARANELRHLGYTVSVEDNNKFTVKGESAILGGKADIFATKTVADLVSDRDFSTFRNVYQVIDVKTGQERESDRWQVRIYQYAYPRSVPNFSGKRIAGILEYGGGRLVNVEPMKPSEFGKFGSLMQLAGGELEPPRTPSRAECASCNIAICPDRDKSLPFEGETKDF
jgi:hypothetical protein